MVKRIKEVKKTKNPVQSKQPAAKAKSSNKSKNLPEIKLPTFVRNYPFLIFGVFLGLMLLVVFRDYIFMTRLFLFKDIGSDTLNTFYPAMVSAGKSAEEGLAYSFQNGMGSATGIGSQSFANSWVSFFINPFSYILHLWQGRNIAFGLGISEVLKIFAAGMLFFAYLRTIKFSQITASVGAFLFSFSGFMMGGSTWYQHSYQLFYIALLLFGFEQALLKKRYYLLLIAISMTFRAFNPFYIYVFGTFLIVYSVLRVILEKNDFKSALLFYAKSGLVLVLAFLINMPFLLQRITSIMHDPRVSGNLNKAEEMQQFSIFAGGGFIHNVTAILRFFSNDILGSGRIQEQFINGNRLLISDYKGYYNYYEAPMFYIGSISLILFPQFLSFEKRKGRILYGLFFLFWLLPVIFPYFRRAYFLFFGDYYRIFSFYLPFAVLLPALLGLEQLLTKNKINISLLWASAVLWLVLLFFPYFSDEYLHQVGLQSSPIVKSVQLIAAFFILAYTLTISLQSKFPEKRNYIMAALALLVVFEPVYMANKTVNDRDTVSKTEFLSKKGYNDYSIEAVKYLQSVDSSFYRTEKDYASSGAVHGSLNDAKVQNYFGTTLYASHQNPYYIDFLQSTGIISPGNETAARWAPGVRSRALPALAVNVKYMLSKSENPYFKVFGYSPLKKFGDVTVYKNDFFLPLGYTYKKKIRRSKFEQLPNLQKDICLMRAVVLNDSVFEQYPELTEYLPENNSVYSKEMLRADADSLIAESLQTNYFRQDHIKGRIKLSKPRMIFFSFLHDTNWRIYANNTLQKNIVANIGFTGVYLPAGKYDIELRYGKTVANTANMISNMLLLALIFLSIIWTTAKGHIKNLLSRISRLFQE